MSRKRMTTQSFLFLALSPLVIFDSDYALILCPLCKSNTLWNILMILGSNEEQDQETCHKNDTVGFFFYFWSYLSLCLNLISCLCAVT